MSFRATRTPETSGPGRDYTAARYDVSLPWPGIQNGFDARCTCTWAMHDGAYQVKIRDAACINHGGASHA